MAWLDEKILFGQGGVVFNFSFFRVRKLRRLRFLAVSLCFFQQSVSHDHFHR